MNPYSGPRLDQLHDTADVEVARRNPYQAIAEKLDLDAALDRVRPNDLLPSRPEDKTRGELGSRFVQDLRRRIDRGAYDPQPSYAVAVPKSTVGTRPAALVSLPDRVVLSAIVDALAPRIESFLLGSDIVFWPRGVSAETRWQDFEGYVVQPEYGYVVRGDVAGFYESVEHEQLAAAVIQATGMRDMADALVHLLQRILGCRRGLPQGLSSSDPLATVYLAKLDFCMVQDGFRYVRHGDDLRVGVKKYDDGRRAVQRIETELRGLGLLLNGSKTRVLRQTTYAGEMRSFEDVHERTRDRIVDMKVQHLAKDSEALLAVIEKADMDQLAWDHFYHGRTDFDDVIEKLHSVIEPSREELASKVFLDAMKSQPGRANEVGSRRSRLFRQCVKRSLVHLSAARSEVPLQHIGSLLRSFPEMTDILCSYLRALSSEKPDEVVAQVEKAVRNRHTSEWELTHLVRALLRASGSVSERTLRLLKKRMSAPHGQWLAAVEIMKLLAARGELEQETVTVMWNTCPTVFRVDVVEAVRQMAETAQWARVFVSAAKSDRIQAVIAGRVDI